MSETFPYYDYVLVRGSGFHPPRGTLSLDVARRALERLGKGWLLTPPYTSQPLEAFMAAQTSAGLVVGASLWLRRLQPWPATALLLSAIALAVLAPVSGDFLLGIGVPIEAGHFKHLLELAAALATLATLVSGRPVLAAVAVALEGSLWVATNYVTDSDWDLAATHLAAFGLLVGIHWLTLPVTPEPTAADSPNVPAAKAWIDDIAAFCIGMLASAIVATVVMNRWTSSGDEWGDTFQAALFAKLRAYGTVPPCGEAFRSFWVFHYMGRAFAQYTPGWPYFMTPFVALGAAWLAGPASLGLLAAGVSRLARRAAAGFVPAPRRLRPPRREPRVVSRRS